MKKLSSADLLQMKKEGRQAAWITAYDYITAQIAEEVGIDMLLVGDSLGMAVYGYSGTVPVTMDQCIVHAEAVRRGAPHTMVIGDMPFGSYHCGVDQACRNAVRFHKDAGVDCIKLEGGVRVANTIRSICDGGMLVMGHVGLTPQSSAALGGFRAQGRTVQSARAIIEDARAVYEAGAFALVVEGVPPEVTAAIMDAIPLPVYGIGSGACDGQVLTCFDLLGLFQAFTPKFVKKYANLGQEYRRAFAAYIEDVRSGAFPGDEHTYSMAEEDRERFTHGG
ncbi:unnamed protein product [Cyprideis torosa]|uniref:3-methyl-2-oxobutanoate hydroxymethyltransferase n=1 Tax=Cyprideis torosa TaxID=163714 RepID=A0A7R8WI56_9CRUS|nr:unnamed protein product [Cyprideis torosa]CAG0900274.1 unnamed protein product [Cyprideis torosa]